MATLIERATALFGELDALPDEERIETLNALRRELHAHSPMGAHPCDCILWVRPEQVQANDYNPNVVAAPEMRLLNKSVEADGYTMPIVTWETGTETYEVVDGFHRHLVGQRNKRVKASTCGRCIYIGPRLSAQTAPYRHNPARASHRGLWLRSCLILPGATGATPRYRQSWGWRQTRCSVCGRSPVWRRCSPTKSSRKPGRPT